MNNINAKKKLINKNEIEQAAKILSKTGIIKKTDLYYSDALSKELGCEVYFKREDQQKNGSFKCRGALLNMLRKIDENPDADEFLCVSAGNHSQGFSMACAYTQKHGTVFMPAETPQIKIEGTKNMGILDGVSYVDIVLYGHDFDEAYEKAEEFMAANPDAILVHPFNDPYTIIGQGTIAKEIEEQLGKKPDFVFCAVGGGGLSAGICSYFQNDDVKIIGGEPVTDASTTTSLLAGKVVPLDTVEHYIEGASVKVMGDLNLSVLQDCNFSMRTVNNDQVHYALANMYYDNLPAEGAGAVPLAALFNYDNKEELKGKTVVLVVSGKNLDEKRRDEVLEKAKAFDSFPEDFTLAKFDK